jgi:thiamine transport system permease protein
VNGTKSLNINLRGGLRVLLGLFLLSPFLIWIWQINTWRWPETAEWLPALALSLRQAFYSSFASMIAGFFLFLCLQGWTSARARKVAEFGLLLPNTMPALFLALGLINVVSFVIAFPFGLGAVIAAHVLLNAGLVAISLDRLVMAKAGGLAENAWLLGAGRWRFWREIGWPVLQGDLVSLFLFVLGVCFTSFSLPLLLSGQRAVTLEVSIFEAIRGEGRWDKAVLLAALQASALFFLAVILPQPFWPPRPSRRSLEFLGWPRAKLLVFLPAFLILLGWALGLKNGWGSMEFGDVLIEAGLTTLILSFSVGLLCVVLFLLIAYVSPHEGLQRFLNGYLAPSPVITGFALLLIPVESDGWNLVKTVLALTIISLPLLYRWMVHSVLSGLTGQIAVARTLGASWSQILFEIVWPQSAEVMLRASGLAALWASGDFALSGIFLGGAKSVPLLMTDLIGNYRIDLAQAMMIPLALIGLVIYFLFVTAARYVSR